MLTDMHFAARAAHGRDMGYQLRRGHSPAFTLIELLTVIAIIAILTAILFPVAATVREQARATDCMTNLHQLWVSANVYREDEGAFPSTLLGYAEGIIQDPKNNAVLDHVPWQPSLAQVGPPNGNPSPTKPLAAENTTLGNLFREDIKDINVFRCPDNTLKDTTLAVMAYYPDVQYVDKSQPYFWGHENDPKDGNPPYGWYGQYLQDNGCPHIANVGTEDCWTNTPENAAILAQYPYLMGQPKWYYAIDAYDVGPAIDFNTGAQIMDPATGNTVPYFYRHYTPDWTGPARPINAPTMGTGQFDLPEQLKYANPPDDKTLLAYCTWHQATATSGRITAVSMSGTAKQFTYRQVLQLTANLYNPGIH